MIPDCYDPVYQEERRQMELDKLLDGLPCCTICRRTLYPGDKFHTACHQIVCVTCKEQLDENEDMVELD